MQFNHDIEVIRRGLRRQKFVSGALALGLVGTLTLGMKDAKIPTDVVATSLTVLNAKGQAGMVVGSGPTGFGLAFLDSSMKPRIAMGLDPKDNTGLVLIDPKGSHRIMMGEENGSAALIVIDGELLETTQAQYKAMEAAKAAHGDT